MKVIALIIVSLTGLLLIYATGDFPDWGDPASPASSYLSTRYIEKTMEDTSVPNIVTAVLGDYRGFDTMFETTVIFSAGVVCFFLLRTFKEKTDEEGLFRHKTTGITLRIRGVEKISSSMGEFDRIDNLWTPQDLIITTACRLLIPFLQLFALYVIAHGHHSPGGGFQGGVILGSSIILFAISHDLRTSLSRISEKGTGLLCAIGAFLFAGTGALCLLLGGNFLDYSILSKILPLDPVAARSFGILIVEVGVGMAVMGSLIWIYGNVSSAGSYRDGL